jgi:hypothetical protein
MSSGVSDELDRLAKRIRTYVIAMILSFFLQGAFLVNALQSDEALGAWLTWVVVLVFAIAAIVFAAVRSGRMAKRYRHLKWGES